MIVDVNLCANCTHCAGTACLANNTSIYEMNGKDCGFFEEDESFYKDNQ